MNSEELYESFIIKVNANAQTNNIAVDRGRFTILYNEASNKFIEWVLEKKNEDEIRYLQPILVTTPISSNKKSKEYQTFPLPKDFFDLGTISATASSECCKSVDMLLTEIKVDNEAFILSNDNTKPSIEYRETVYYLENNSVKIFRNDFSLDKIKITYYKYPTPIEIINIDDPESDFKNKDKNLEFDNKVLDRIISIAAADFDLNTNNPKYQADKLRVQSKF